MKIYIYIYIKASHSIQDDKMHNTYRSSTIGPRILPDHTLLSLFILKVYLEHFCKVLAQTMRSCTLNTTSSVRNKCLAYIDKYKTFWFSQRMLTNRDGLHLNKDRLYVIYSKYLNTGCVKSSSEFLSFTFPTFYNRNCQEFFIYTPVQFQYLKDLMHEDKTYILLI